MTDDATIRRVLELPGTWAVVGWSPRPGRASNEVAAYLEEIGHPVIRVNPEVVDAGAALGLEVVASLADIDGPVSVVDVFRRSSLAGAVVDEAVAIGARAVWLQLGVFDDAATERARGPASRWSSTTAPASSIPG